MRKFNSILVPPEEQERIDTEHPMCYFKTRNHFLENILGQMQLKSNLNATDLQRNIHVQYLTRAYDKMKQKVVLAQREKQRYLNPNTFQTILDTRVTREQQEIERHKLRLQHQRNELYDRFIQNYAEEPQPQQEAQIAILPTIIQPNLSATDQRRILLRQRQMELLDNQINALREQLELQSDKGKGRDLNPYHACTNMSLIERMSGSIISSYMVHFDQVFNLLIDEILTEEVRYLNSVEEEWKDQKVGDRQQERGRDLRPEHYKLVQLVRTLDELCDM